MIIHTRMHAYLQYIHANIQIYHCMSKCIWDGDPKGSISWVHQIGFASMFFSLVLLMSARDLIDPVFLEEDPADQLICNGRIVTKFRKLLMWWWVLFILVWTCMNNVTRIGLPLHACFLVLRPDWTRKGTNREELWGGIPRYSEWNVQANSWIAFDV